MNLRHLILARTSRTAQRLILLAAILLTAGIGYLHLMTGLAYEFHIFFILPVLIVGWFVSTVNAIIISLLSVALWYLVDRELGGHQADNMPLLFNSTARLSIFLCVIWLLRQVRAVLDRESVMARQDSLTRLANRRGFTALGNILLGLAQRQNMPISAMFIDLDRFKEVNDKLGHKIGDELLKTVADVIRGHMRTSDTAGRWGGDEFALLLPGSGPDAIAIFAESLRQRLQKAMHDRNWPVTFSIGVASFATPPADLEQMLQEADALMYEVKHGGRDRVLIRQCQDSTDERLSCHGHGDSE